MKIALRIYEKKVICATSCTMLIREREKSWLFLTNWKLENDMECVMILFKNCVSFVVDLRIITFLLRAIIKKDSSLV